MAYANAHHKIVCKSYQPALDLSLDGIQESKSSGSSLDVYSISFNKCRTVYPIRIIKTMNKYKIDEQLHLEKVISDINTNRCIICNGIFDNPKRSTVRFALGHSAYYACEYCESKAKYVKLKTKEGKSKGHLAWPFSTFDGPLRTKDKIIDIAERIENGEVLDRDEARGIVGT